VKIKKRKTTDMKIKMPNEHREQNPRETFALKRVASTAPWQPLIWCRPLTLAATLVLIGSAASGTLYAQSPHSTEAYATSSQIRIPPAMRAEHAEIHDQLVAATRIPGKVGEAARKLAAILDPHFEREEQIALPPLGLLAPLSRGEFSTGMRDVLPMTDALRAELPRMLKEHKAIHAATVRLGEVAKAEDNAPVARLADTLQSHAANEEEVSYPAALLVGDVVRARLAKGAQR
jgi:Hemerythrin HHE cation binding domain